MTSPTTRPATTTVVASVVVMRCHTRVNKRRDPYFAGVILESVLHHREYPFHHESDECSP